MSQTTEKDLSVHQRLDHSELIRFVAEGLSILGPMIEDRAIETVPPDTPFNVYRFLWSVDRDIATRWTRAMGEVFNPNEFKRGAQLLIRHKYHISELPDRLSIFTIFDRANSKQSLASFGRIVRVPGDYPYQWKIRHPQSRTLANATLEEKCRLFPLSEYLQGMLHLVLSQLEIVAGDHSPDGESPFTRGDYAEYVCNWIIRILANYDSHARPDHLLECFGWPESHHLLYALTRQLINQRIWLQHDGLFSAEGDQPNAIPVPITLPTNDGRLIQDILVAALRNNWMTADEAETIIGLHHDLEPWCFMTRDSSEAKGAARELQEAEVRFRGRFKSVVDTFLMSGGSEKCYSDRSTAIGAGLVGTEQLFAVLDWLSNHPGLEPVKSQHRVLLDIRLKELAYVRRLDSSEDESAVRERLSKYPRNTLLEVLPYSGAAQSLVLQAAGLGHLDEFRRWMIAMTKLEKYRVDRPCCVEALPASTDPEDGVIDIAEARRVLSAIKVKDRDCLLKSYVKSGFYTGMKQVVEAVTGEADSHVLFINATAKLQQRAIKLLGVLPTNDIEAVYWRYLAFQQLYKSASQHGAQRQATQRAAVLAGLANLAQVSGHGDRANLEWAMELRRAADIRALLQAQTIEQYTAQIEINRFSAELVLTNSAGKRLTSAPAAIKRAPELLALKEGLAEIRSQFQRFARLMEMRMIHDQPIAYEQVVAGLEHPVMAPILRGLAWIDEAGNVGLLNDGMLRGPSGEVGVVGNSLRVAHPARLFGMAGDSTAQMAWQRWVVAQGLTQPFKQLFREIYVPTPAEREAAVESNRYKHRAIKTGPAQGLFQARGWIVYNDDGHWACHHPSGASAECFFATGRYFTEEPSGELLAVRFRDQGKPVDLASVDPIFFSEVMRDLDLVASVAHDEGDEPSESGAPVSEATLALRIALLSAIRPSLGDNVLSLDADRNHALVRGQLASYRIHLSTGHVYILPATYLCIIPAGELARRSINLPFAEQDIVTAEIVSKVMLLAHDSEIRDKSILAQIKRE